MKRNNKTLAKIKRGFTLVELVIVIAVIAILAAVLIPTFITVIDNANNSADVQLARNLNTALAEAQVDPDIASSAQNIRYKVKDFGYDADQLATKKAGNVIAYNKKTQRAEVLDVSKVTADQLVPAYYAEEVIDGYIIISTAGNDLAEALYKLATLPAADPAAVSLLGYTSEISPLAETKSIGDYVKGALNGISNDEIRSQILTVVQSTIYISADGKMITIDVDGDNVTANTISKSDIETWTGAGDGRMPATSVHTRVVFSEAMQDDVQFDLMNLMQAKSALQVIIPESANVTNSYTGSYDDMPTFSGKVDGNNIPSENVKPVSEQKDRVKEGDEAPFLYNANQIYTSDFGNSFEQTLAMAAKIHAVEGNQEKTIRLVVNGKVTISHDVTIPAYVEVEIPFAIGNNNARKVMEYSLGDVLGGKALGSAYPANDAKNLQKSDDDKQYYLCGEGPGGGADFWMEHAGIGDMKKDQQTTEIFDPSKNIAKANRQSEFVLTVANGANLTIEGRLTAGAVIVYPDASSYQGHTSGAYAQINNNGKITVGSGGVLDVWGFLKGSGEVVATEKGMVFEPFVVTDYADTLATLWLYPFVGTEGKGPEDGIKFNSPFMRYTVMNIQTKITLQYGASLFGRANLMTFGGFLYCRTDAPLVTSEGYVYDKYTKTVKTIQELENEGYTAGADNAIYTNGENKLYAYGAFSLQEGASLVGTYDGNKTVGITEQNSEEYEWSDVANRNSLAGDIGVNNITFHGEVETHGIQLDLLGGAINMGSSKVQDVMKDLKPLVINTAWCVLPVPYFYNFTIATDSTFTIDNGNRYALMPGSALTVEGKLEVKNGDLYALDVMDNSPFYRGWNTFYNMLFEKAPPADENGIFKILEMPMLNLSLTRKYYPSTKLLNQNGFSTYAELRVNGSATVEQGGDFGGTVVAADDATINIKEGAGMGRVISLGGPYESDTTYFRDVIGQQYKETFCPLTTVYAPCYLHVVNSQGKEVGLTKMLDEKSVQQQMAVILSLQDNSSLITAQSEGSEGNYQITINLPYWTAKQDINISNEAITGATSQYSRGTKVAYYELDMEGKRLMLKDSAVLNG